MLRHNYGWIFFIQVMSYIGKPAGVTYVTLFNS